MRTRNALFVGLAGLVMSSTATYAFAQSHAPSPKPVIAGANLAYYVSPATLNVRTGPVKRTRSHPPSGAATSFTSMSRKATGRACHARARQRDGSTCHCWQGTNPRRTCSEPPPDRPRLRNPPIMAGP